MQCFTVNRDGFVVPVYPTPADLTTCSLVIGNYAEMRPSDLFGLTPEQGLQIGTAIVLVWAIAFGYRAVIRVLSLGESQPEKE